MKKIALVNLRFKIDIKFEQKESLGIAYIAAMLMSKGHEVKIIDAQYFDLEVNEVYDILMQDKYDLIGFSLYEETAPFFERLYYMLEGKTNSHICLGGHFASFYAEKLLKRFPQVNSIIIGEGEVTVAELVDLLPEGEWKKVDGICYMENNNLVYTKPRKLIADLDSIPYPYRDPYFESIVDTSNLSATISASRGCYANCSFCSIQSFYNFLRGKRIRVREPEKLVDEIEYVNKKYGIKKFFFADDNFLATNLIKSDWLDRFISEIEKRDLRISFDIDCRVNDIEEKLFMRLKKVGLNGVFLGVESFAQRALDTLNKKVLVQDNINAINLLHKLRITVWMGFIMFDMFTTLDEIRHNLKALHEIRYFTYFNYDRPVSGDRLASPLKLYNGTPILEKLMKESPEVLIENDYGYDYKFVHPKTAKFYAWLLKWKEVSKEMIQLDTLWLIRLANERKLSDIAAKLHSLSRKYMRVDLQAFEGILNAVDSGDEEIIEDFMEQKKNEFYEIKQEVEKLRGALVS